MEYRHAGEADIPELVRMAKAFLDLTPYGALFPPLPGHLEQMTRLTLQHGTAFVAEVDGRLVGMLGIVLVPHPLNGMTYAEEVVWWVDPPHRKGTVGPRLLDLAERWAADNSATMCKMVAPVGSEVGIFLERRGYAGVESAHVKIFGRASGPAPMTIEDVDANDLEALNQRE